MTDEVDDTLFAAAEAVADGFDVDWAALRERAGHIAEDLEQMRAVADIGDAYRSIRERLLGEG